MTAEEWRDLLMRVGAREVLASLLEESERLAITPSGAKDYRLQAEALVQLLVGRFDGGGFISDL